MKANKLFDALSNADDDLVERAAGQMKTSTRRKKPYFFPLAAALIVIILSVSVVATVLREAQRSASHEITTAGSVSGEPEPSETAADIDNGESDPPETVAGGNADVTEEKPSHDIEGTEPEDSAPTIQFIESPEPWQGLIGEANLTVGGESAELRGDGIYARVKAVRILPDKYRFFSDKNEFYLAEMQTLSALPESKMPERFYFLIPEAYLADLTAYPTLILRDMWQFGYEDSVLYNTSEQRAEMLPLAIFASNYSASHLYCERIMAFDEDGIFDVSLWDSSDIWKNNTAFRNQLESPPSYAVIGYGWTADMCEEAIRKLQDDTLDANSLSGITNEEVLAAIAYARDPENGLFVPSNHYDIMFLYPQVQITYRRYINGYPTDEYIHIFGDKVTCSAAIFSQKDENYAPDLENAVSSVSKEFDEGKLTPPHIALTEDHKLIRHGIFAWYAQTKNGIVGIVKVSWHYEVKWNDYLDDMYYIIEPNSTNCTPIDRDELLSLTVSSEYIFDGEYSENGMNYPLEPKY